MLGDSLIEYGEWQELIKTKYSILNSGVGGDTTIDLLNRMSSISTNIKKTFLMVGVNDLMQGRSVDEIFFNYESIIKQLTEKNIEPIIMSTLYTGSDYAQYYNNDIKKLNKLIYSYSKEHNIIYIDVNSVLSDDNDTLKYKYSLDGVHINNDGYFKWSTLIAKYF